MGKDPRAGFRRKVMNIEQALRAAIDHHQAGRLQDAESGYRSVLQLEPDHSGALHMLGALAHQRGNHEMAVALIEKSIAYQPSPPEDHYKPRNVLWATPQIHKA